MYYVPLNSIEREAEMKVVRAAVGTRIDLAHSHIPPIVQRILIQMDDGTGNTAFITGGTSRDLLRGKTPVDWDIAIAASEEHLQAAFAKDPEVHVTETQGKSFGVCRVTSDNCPGVAVDVARFRSDGTYKDHRHPITVQYLPVVEGDLKRRDFTMNAIAINHTFIMYPEGALDDLEYGVFRAVGFAHDRFKDDPLRILRLFRQYAQGHGTHITGETLDAVTENRDLLRHISAERVRDELTKLLLSPDSGGVERSLRLMRKLGILEIILPEVACLYGIEQTPKYHVHDVFEHTIRVVSHTPLLIHLRMAALLHDTGKLAKKTIEEDGTVHFYKHELASADIAHEVLTRLKFSNDQIKFITGLVRWHTYAFWQDPTPKKFRRLIARMGGTVGPIMLLRLRRADRIGQGVIPFDTIHENYCKARRVLQDTLKEEPVTDPRGLAVNGRDVIEVAGVQGSDIGLVLRTLTEMVIEDPTINEREGLLARLAKYKISGRLV